MTHRTRLATAAPLMPGLFLLVSLHALAAEPQGSPRDTPAIIHTDIVTRQAYCKWAAKPPVLDGKLDDPCWQDGWIEQFAAFWLKTPEPRPGTKAYLMWDADYLYYGATMADSELRSYGKARNDTLWDGDVFELFFKPSLNDPKYYEFQANPKALVFEAQFTGKPGGDADLKTLPPLGNFATITLNGTLDKPGDKDTGWTVEARIPGPPSPPPRQAQARRPVVLRSLPLRLRPRRHQAHPHELRSAHTAKLPPHPGLRQTVL